MRRVYVDIWIRLLRLARPYRWRLFGSLALGGLVALCWSAELMLTFPVVKVFLQDQTLSSYLQQEIETSHRQTEEWQASLSEARAELAKLPAVGDRQERQRRVQLVADEARLQRKIDVAARRLWAATWVESNILPWLPQDMFRLLCVFFLMLLGVTLLKGLSLFSQDVLAGGVAELLVVDLRKAMFRALLKTDPLTVQVQGPPQLMARFTYDLQALSHWLTELGGRVIREPLKAAACMIAAFAWSWQLTTLALLIVPLTGSLFVQVGKLMRRASQRALDSMGRIYKSLEETFDNIRVVTAFGTARVHRRKFHRQNREFFAQACRIVSIEAAFGPTTELLGLMGVLMGLLPAAYLVLSGKTDLWGVRLTSKPMDASELAVFYALLAGVLDPIRKCSRYYTMIRRAHVTLERVFAQIDHPSRVTDPAAPKLLPRQAPTLEFQQVAFHYLTESGQPSPRPSLSRINLTIQAGEVVAIVGPNGSGKSTLVNLIPRFADPDSGTILWNDVPLTETRLRDLRSQIAIVPQDAALFEGTIKQNIRYGRPDATEQELLDAATRARVIDFAEHLPDGLDAPVGPWGGRLSGGQRQRVAMARAMVADPSLLILDEPTSAIDAESERLIQQSLCRFAPGRTVLIITHGLNLELLKFVGRIVVLDRGEIVAQGTHAQLLSTCPLYRQLLPSTAATAATESAAAETAVVAPGSATGVGETETLVTDEAGAGNAKAA